MSDLNAPLTTIERRQVIKSKPYLERVYRNFYKILSENSINIPRGKKIEIGSGAGFIKEVMPSVLTSDIIKLPFCDYTFSAEKIPFKSGSVSAFYMLNTFHHIKNPEKALKELSRTLAKNGKVVMIEPANTRVSRFIYKYFHHEDFNENTGWKITSKGNLSGSNQAMAYIIFKRDRNKFNKLFKSLKIIKFENHTPFSYLISGGFSYPSLLPVTIYKYISALEKALSPLINQLGIFTTIVLKKI